MPSDRELLKVPRQWLIDVAFTVIGDPFANLVEEIIAKRNEELAVKQNLVIEMDPDIAEAFRRSQNISSK